MAMMKGFSNAFRIPELRKKILITLGLVFVCRLVSQIPTPGVDWQALQRIIADFKSQGAGGGMLDWFEVFTGGALGQCAIGFLSIWPYISAQIVIQLLGSVIPARADYALPHDRPLRRAVLGHRDRPQPPGDARPCVRGHRDRRESRHRLPPDDGDRHDDRLSLRHVARRPDDQITTFGIGNGASLIIMINITSRLPQALIGAWERYFGLAGVKASAPIAELPILILFFLIVVMGTVMLTQGVRKVAIHSTRRSVGGGNTYGMQQTFMPLRVNYTGVMPIIFAQPLIQIPAAILVKMTDATSGGLSGRLNSFGQALADPGSALHVVIYAALIMFFAFFWVATQFNAIDISDNLKKDGSYVPGIRPGRATAEYLDDLMTKITLIGGTGLLIVALIPMLLMGWMRLPWVIASFFGGTSLLIIVGVALDTLRIMESHLLVRKYEGFLSHGSLRGRGGM